jgi:hypothetical protein
MARQDLEARIRHLEDVEQITNVIAQYGFLLDDLQPATSEAQLQKFVDLFTDDLVDEQPNANGPGTNIVCNGKAEFLKWLRQEGVGSPVGFSPHEFFAPWIEVDGDHATAEIYSLGPCLEGPPGQRRAFWIHGSYKNEYRRVNGRWLIKHRVYTRSFLTPYEVGWHKVGFDRDLGERGRCAALSAQHAKLVEASGNRVEAGPGERWRV